MWFVLILPNEFIPFVAKPSWIFLDSLPNSRNLSWKFFHWTKSVGCRYMPSHFLSSTCHLRFLASFGFANKRFILEMMGRYHITFIGGPCFFISSIVSSSFCFNLWCELILGLHILEVSLLIKLFEINNYGENPKKIPTEHKLNWGVK